MFFFSQNTTLWKKAKSYNECNCSLEWIDDNYIVHVAVLFNTFVISSLWIIINLNHMIFLQLSVVVPKRVKKTLICPENKVSLSCQRHFAFIIKCKNNYVFPVVYWKKKKSLFTLQSRIPYCVLHIGIHSFAAHVCPRAFKTGTNC